MTFFFFKIQSFFLEFYILFQQPFIKFFSSVLMSRSEHALIQDFSFPHSLKVIAEI